jgi:hypothetical protein
MSIPIPKSAEEAVREELSEWEHFTASDGQPSIRMRESRTPEEVARAIIAAVRGPLYREAAEAILASEHLRNLTDDHMGDIDMAACELRRLAQVKWGLEGPQGEPSNA